MDEHITVQTLIERNNQGSEPYRIIDGWRKRQHSKAIYNKIL